MEPTTPLTGGFLTAEGDLYESLRVIYYTGEPLNLKWGPIPRTINTSLVERDRGLVVPCEDLG